MNPNFQSIVLATALLVFSFFDLKYRKIPNHLIILFSTIGIVLRGSSFIAPFIQSFLISLIIYHLGLISAGDLKIYCLISGYAGSDSTTEILFVGAIMYVTVQGWRLILCRKNEISKTAMAPYYFAAYAVILLRGSI